MKISLQTIRISKGFTEEEAANRCEITLGKMREFENRPGKMPASVAIKLRGLYGIPIDYISV